MSIYPFQTPGEEVWLDPKNIAKTPFTSGGMTGRLGYVYLEPKCPLFWMEKIGFDWSLDLLLEAKQRTNGFQVYKTPTS